MITGHGAKRERERKQKEKGRLSSLVFTNFLIQAETEACTDSGSRSLSAPPPPGPLSLFFYLRFYNVLFLPFCSLFLQFYSFFNVFISQHSLGFCQEIPKSIFLNLVLLYLQINSKSICTNITATHHYVRNGQRVREKASKGKKLVPASQSVNRARIMVFIIDGNSEIGAVRT